MLQPARAALTTGLLCPPRRSPSPVPPGPQPHTGSFPSAPGWEGVLDPRTSPTVSPPAGLASPPAGQFANIQLKFPAEKYPQNSLWFLLSQLPAEGEAVCLSSPPAPHILPAPFIPGKNPGKITNINSAPVTKTTFLTDRQKGEDGGGAPSTATSPQPHSPWGLSRTVSSAARRRGRGGVCRAPLHGAVSRAAACVFVHLRGAAFTADHGGLGSLRSQWQDRRG